MVIFFFSLRIYKKISLQLISHKEQDNEVILIRPSSNYNENPLV